MSMTVDLIPKTDSGIDALRQRTPEEVSAEFEALYREMLEAVRAAKGLEIFEVRPQRSIFDLHKAWHGIHFLLTGSAWEGGAPLGYLMTGLTIGAPPREEGREKDEYPEDDGLWGYGPPHAVYSHEVRAWSEALEPLTEEVLRARFDPKAFQAADLYSIKNAPEEEFDWVMAFYNPFREYLRQMAEAGSGLIVHMT